MNTTLISSIVCLIFVATPAYAQSKGENNSGGSSSINSTNIIDHDPGGTRDMTESKMGNMDRNQHHSDDMMEEQSKERERVENKKENDRSNNAASSIADTNKGLARQRERTSDQEQRELDKGSEQGQTARQENSRKWWKFWE